MNVNAKIIYTVSFNREELNLIRRALDKFGGHKAPALASKIVQDLTETRKQLVAAIDAALKVEEDVPAITTSNEDYMGKRAKGMHPALGAPYSTEGNTDEPEK